MPKGVYRRIRFGVETNIEWLPEQDAFLQEECKGINSFSVISQALNTLFPDNPKSRNAVLGRCARKGWSKTKPVKAHWTNTEQASQTRRASFARTIANRKASNPPMPRKRATIKQETDPRILRAESDPGATRGYSRKLSQSDPALKERKKGYLPAIVEEKPLTSVVMIESDRDCCKWPTSEDVRCMEVCGADATVGAYCERHAQLAYRVMPTRKRNRTYLKDNNEHRVRSDGSHSRRDLDVDGQWLADQLLGSDVYLLEGPDDGISPLLLPHFMEKLA